MIMLARKWRPQTFDEVAGQNPTVQTLKNAISFNQVAQAYLFAGPRGSGKTTLARLLAKAMNCSNGPTVTPCNQCPSCKEIASSNSIDVMEIDGASNRGINEVRELREIAQYMPNRDRYKIIIIDEVHMLTVEAFNALLKILEEPPLHVIFIFATTELRKVPATITSRCQQFEFRRLHEHEINERLLYIIQQENIAISTSALTMLLKVSEGSLRDALSILDQLISYSGNNITTDTVIKLLGFLNVEHRFDLTESLLQNNLSKTLTLIHDFLEKGYGARAIYYDLCSHFRNLLVLLACPDQTQLINLDEHEKELLIKQTKDTDQITVLRILTALLDANLHMRYSDQPSIYLEMLLAKVSQLKKLRSLEEIIKKLETGAGSGNLKNPSSTNSLFSDQHWQSQENAKPQPVEINLPTKNKSPESVPTPKQTIPPASSEDDIAPSQLPANELIFNAVLSSKPLLHSFLTSPEQITIQENILHISFPANLKLLQSQIEKGDNRDIIIQTANKMMGRKISLSITYDFIPQPQNASEEYVQDENPTPPSEPPPDDNIEPIIKKATELFDGKIIKEKKRRQ